MSENKIVNLREWLKTHDEQDFNFRETLHYYCSSYLGGIWAKAKIEDIAVEKLCGGTINNIILCSLPSTFKPIKKDEPTKIVLRIYCVPDKSIVAETVITQILDQNNLGPKLYGILNEARMEEYICGRPITIEEAGILPISKEIARNFARIHKLNIPICKLSNFMDFIDDWFLKLSTNPLCPEFFDIPEWYHSHAPKKLTLELIKNEIEFIRSKLPKLNQNIVFCHNDLNGGNILLDHANPKPTEMAENFKPKLMFIDFEFATYNPRGFDLADHFSRYACDYSALKAPYTNIKKLASKEHMLEFMIAYIEEWNPNMNEEEKKFEAEKLLKETMTFIPISPFYWGGYMINHVLNHPSTFDAFGLAIERFGIYFNQKYLFENL